MFNNNSRTKNATLSVASGVISQVVKVALSFGYRTVFVMILAEEILGLNNLFTSVLGVLSLAELGIGAAINTRMYELVAKQDKENLAAYLNFFKRVYFVIILVIGVLGFSLLPFLKYFIKDYETVSSLIDVNLAYSLFMFQVLSEYMFIDKQGILYADQRGYILSIASMFSQILRISLQITLLILTKNYIFTIVINIVSTITINLIIDIWIRIKYNEIFVIKKRLEKSGIKGIFKDTYALLCHRIGSTVTNSVDNILISSFIGLAIGGLYSNYTIIITALNMLFSQILSTFMGSIGNLKYTSNREHEYNVYKRLLFFNFTIASFCVTELFNLANPFITIWIGEKYKLSILIVLALSLNFFITCSRQVNTSTTIAVSLFHKDKLRPIIEAAANLLISIGLIYLFGSSELFGNIHAQMGPNGKENLQLFGILLGTTFSMLPVALWREVYILHKFEFNKKPTSFYKMYACFFILTVITTAVGYLSTFKIPTNWGYWFLKAIIILVEYIIIYSLFTFKTSYFKYFTNLIKVIFIKIGSKTKLTSTHKKDISQNYIYNYQKEKELYNSENINKSDNSNDNENIINLDSNDE